MTEELSLRTLNRATLARQYLLDRVPARALAAVEHLAGLQSQAPLAPYIGLWTRLRDFAAQELSDVTEARHVVRLHLMQPRAAGQRERRPAGERCSTPCTPPSSALTSATEMMEWMGTCCCARPGGCWSCGRPPGPSSACCSRSFPAPFHLFGSF